MSATAPAETSSKSGGKSGKRKYFEVIYETGAHAVVHGTEEEVLGGLTEHHRRATEGELGGPAGQPAERVKRVLVYDEHPGSYREDYIHPADDINGYVKDAIEEIASPNGEVHLPTLIEHLWMAGSPLYRKVEQDGRLNSQFRATETAELDPKQWGGE
jgi:hypothetical protein